MNFPTDTTTSDTTELTYEPIADIDHDPAWETMCELGREMAAETDGKQWDLGDLALEVDKQYGKNRIGEFAKSIGVPVSTVKQYRRMSAYYEQDTRTAFANLSRSHFLYAIMGKDVSASLELLTKASNGDWTVERTKIERKREQNRPLPPKKLMDYEGQVIRMDMQLGQLVIEFAPGANMLNMSDLINLPLRFKVYEVAAA